MFEVSLGYIKPSLNKAKQVKNKRIWVHEKLENQEIFLLLGINFLAITISRMRYHRTTQEDIQTDVRTVGAWESR